MNIDAPRREDLPALRQLWKDGFGDPDSFLDGFFATGFSPRRCRCLLWEDRPAAVLYWFDCRWQDRRVAYIYAVATDPDHRGKGLCRRLMEDTHKHLASLGYVGAALVPGSRELFALYGKLGYRPFCPMTKTTLRPQGSAIPALPLSAEDYVNCRNAMLPPNALAQSGAAAAYLATYCRFYRAGDNLFSLSREDKDVYFQEYLGDPAALPGILAGLDADRGTVRLPGGDPYAMYLPFTESTQVPGYLGLPLD